VLPSYFQIILTGMPFQAVNQLILKNQFGSRILFLVKVKRKVIFGFLFIFYFLITRSKPSLGTRVSFFIRCGKKENWNSRKMPLEDLKKHLLLDAFESSSHSNQIQ
jgi:hypothetical protein